MQDSPIRKHGHLRTSGNAIVDQNGLPVTLRGTSLFWSQWQPQFYNARAINWLREDWRVDVVRAAVAVHHHGYLEYPERERAKIEAVIEAAIAVGIYVIVDWHAHYPEPEAAGVFFEAIARRYGAYPNLIYETWNEPLDEHDWGSVIKPYHEELIDRIRRHAPHSLIVAGTSTWSQDVDIAAADPLPFDNVAYALHFYAATHGQSLRDKAATALAAGVALMVTEWGTCRADGDGVLDEEQTRIWWSFLEEHGISHLNWSVADKNETSAVLLPGAPAGGGWSTQMLSPSGRLVRDRLRLMGKST